MQNLPKLAIVDDDPDTQELISAFFKPRGYVVKAYGDASELLKEFQKSKVCEHDIIITDLNLPNITGIEFIEMVKEQGITVPIILITVQKSVEFAVKAIRAGAYDFVVKPIHFPQLLVTVERALYFHQIRAENETLKLVLSAKQGTSLDGIIGRSPCFLKAIDLVKRVAPSKANIFITGETGTGKEVIARAIHHFSTRKKDLFLAVNCSAIPENLLESEFFGHAKGSFTGASDKRIGLFEEADGGTIFLDEVGDLSFPLQAKLLRVLQEKKIKRIGENQMRSVDVRIISATNKDLRKEVLEKRFREDLFFRLNVIPITLPPLRERSEDVLPLAEFFLKKFSIINDKPVKTISKDAMAWLLMQPWRGNVRELENTIERAVVLCEGTELVLSDVQLENVGLEYKSVEDTTIARVEFNAEDEMESLESVTNRYIAHSLKRNNGAKDKTAKSLGIDRKTLYRRILDIDRGLTHS